MLLRASRVHVLVVHLVVNWPSNHRVVDVVLVCEVDGIVARRDLVVHVVESSHLLLLVKSLSEALRGVLGVAMAVLTPERDVEHVLRGRVDHQRVFLHHFVAVDFILVLLPVVLPFSVVIPDMPIGGDQRVLLSVQRIS